MGELPRDGLDTTLYEDNIQALLTQLKRRALQQNPIAFYGSSSFKMWERMGEDLGDLRVVNLGFGGGTFASGIYYADRILTPIRPEKIVLYFGENDISMDGMTAQSAFNDFRRLLEVTRARIDPVQFVVLSVKQSPAKWLYADEVTRLNTLIANYCRTDSSAIHVDVTTCLLGANGRPMGRYFKDDAIHLNHSGYALWADIIKAVLGFVNDVRLAVSA